MALRIPVVVEGDTVDKRNGRAVVIGTATNDRLLVQWPDGLLTRERKEHVKKVKRKRS